MALSERWTRILVDIRDIFVFSLTEVYPAEISTGSRTIRPEPASTVRSFTKARIQVSFSFDAYLFKQTSYTVTKLWSCFFKTKLVWIVYAKPVQLLWGGEKKKWAKS